MPIITFSPVANFGEDPLIMLNLISTAAVLYGEKMKMKLSRRRRRRRKLSSRGV